MTRLVDSDISKMGVPEKWTCGTKGECYNSLVHEIAKLPYIPVPLVMASKGGQCFTTIVYYYDFYSPTSV